MELQRGVCNLCTENNKVLKPSEASEFIDLIPLVINNKFFLESEFQQVKSGIKLCTICCYKLKLVTKIKKAIKSVKLPESTEDQDKLCRFCNCEENLIRLNNNWKYFNDRTEGLLEESEFPVNVCPKCFFYFDVTYNFKKNLLFKYPQIHNQKIKPSPARSALRQNSGISKNITVNSKLNTPVEKPESLRKTIDTPKRKSSSKSPPSAKRRKIFDNCFNYLQPLSNASTYKIRKSIKRDDRMFKNIPYVDLSVTKQTPKTRPIIKIKLKPKHRKTVEIIQVNNYEERNSKVKISNKTAFVKLSKSEEGPNKSHKIKSRRPLRRNSSYVEEKTEENIEETPKAATNAKLVPKRRVSMLVEPTVETHNEETKDQSSSPSQLAAEENKVGDNIVGEEKFPEVKLDLFDEIEKNVEESEQENKSNKNGLLEENEETENLFTNNVNGEESQEHKTENVENLGNDPIIGGNHDENGSPVPMSDKIATKEFDDGINPDDDENGNGSERKKKRVTFSDEVN